MDSRKLASPIIDVGEAPDKPSGFRFSRLFASLIFGGLAVLFLVRAIDFYMATELFGYVFASLRGTWLPDEITQALAVLLTGIAVLYIPMLGWRLLFGFSFSPQWAKKTGAFLGFKSQYKRSLFTVTVVGALWIVFSYWISMPAKGELFNAYTASPRYKYFQDEAGWISEFPIGYQVHPNTGERLNLFTVEVAKKYHEQRKKAVASTPASVAEPVLPAVTAAKSPITDPEACGVFIGGKTDYVYALDGSGARLWIKQAKFYPNKTVVDVAITAGAGRISPPMPDGSRFISAVQDREVWFGKDYTTYATTFNTNLTLRAVVYSRWNDAPYEYSIVMGPLPQPVPLIFQHPEFGLYRFPIEYKGCPRST